MNIDKFRKRLLEACVPDSFPTFLSTMETQGNGAIEEVSPVKIQASAPRLNQFGNPDRWLEMDVSDANSSTHFSTPICKSFSLTTIPKGWQLQKIRSENDNNAESSGVLKGAESQTGEIGVSDKKCASKISGQSTAKENAPVLKTSALSGSSIWNSNVANTLERKCVNI